ncbi:hypothetical protein [Mycobacterium paraintracellulare]|uniref:hypothetical protein n=1 Tax=Mycobacterium paraintracellulare TaxID=1138383 RepID=UPI00191587A7|nr:hypothetical protein [Mycobacterium paraintracellulare]
MSTELVRVWCNPPKGGRHRIATVVPDVIESVTYYKLLYKAEAGTLSEQGERQTFAVDASDFIDNSSSTTYEAYCPGCKAPIQLNSQELQSCIDQAQHQKRTIEIRVSPKSALEVDRLWQKAAELNQRPQDSIYPNAKNRLRNDPRRSGD